MVTVVFNIVCFQMKRNHGLLRDNIENKYRKINVKFTYKKCKRVCVCVWDKLFLIKEDKRLANLKFTSIRWILFTIIHIIYYIIYQRVIGSISTL